MDWGKEPLTLDAPAAAEGSEGTRVPRLGSTIRRLRAARGLTLLELAQRSHISTGMLSQIERDQANPSLRVLSQLRDGLGASMSALLAEDGVERSEADFVCRAGSRAMLDLGFIQQELLAVGRPGGMQMMILHLPPGADSDAHSFMAPVEKAGIVLHGSVLLRVGETEALLKEGDSFMFDGTLSHGFRNPDAAPAQILWVKGAPRITEQPL